MKKTQLVTVWLLPLILIGGLLNPLLGYLVVAMMAVFLSLAFFRGRWWCWHLCPRGAFLDGVLSKVSPNKGLPKIFTRPWFRWLVLGLLMLFLIIRISGTGGNIRAIGAVFVGMCILTTAFSIVLGLLTRHRAWCAICPMGTLQDKIGKISYSRNKGGDNHV